MLCATDAVRSLLEYDWPRNVAREGDRRRPHEKAKVGGAVPAWVFTGAPLANLFVEVFTKDVAFWKAHDPTTLAENLEPGTLALYLDCGTKDEYRLDLNVRLLDSIFERRGIAREFHLIEGGRHDNAFWTDRVDDSLAFFARHFDR